MGRRNAHKPVAGPRLLGRFLRWLQTRALGQQQPQGCLIVILAHGGVEGGGRQKLRMGLMRAPLHEEAVADARGTNPPRTGRKGGQSGNALSATLFGLFAVQGDQVVFGRWTAQLRLNLPQHLLQLRAINSFTCMRIRLIAAVACSCVTGSTTYPAGLGGRTPHPRPAILWPLGGRYVAVTWPSSGRPS